MRIKLKFYIPEIFLGMMLAVAIFVMGGIFWSSGNFPTTKQTTQQQTDNKNSEGKQTKSIWIPEDSTGFFTLWVALFTGILAFSTIRLYGATRDAAFAAHKQATISAVVEGPLPLIVSLKIVQYPLIPGTTTLGPDGLTDHVQPGPIPPNCRVLIAVENKGRTVARMRELCIEKYIGAVLPANPTYTHVEPWGLMLEKGPIWIQASDALANITPAEVLASIATYPNGAFWVYGYFAYLDLLNERVEHKFLARWDLASGFVPDNRPGYT
jgi:hypothetical protein